MKSNFFLVLLAAMASTTIMVSCDDDDSGVDTGGKVSSSSYSDIEGQRVKSVGSRFSCSYDENGNLASYYDYGESYNLQLNPFKLEWTSNRESDVYEIKLNSKGLISQIINKFSYTSSSESESGTATYEISYNGNNQISSIAVSGSTKWSYEEEQGTSSGTGTITFTYSGTVLKKVTQNATESENGKKYKYESTTTFRYNNEYENPFFQYTPVYAEVALINLEGLGYVGMFGKASSILPDYIDWEEKEDDYTDSGSERCSYSFNSNGSIKIADGCSYSYTTVSTRSVEEMVQEYTGEKKARKSFGFFMYRSHRK